MSLSLVIEMPDPDASRLLEAIGPDNEEFVDARVVGGSLVLSMEADTPMALLHTVDDLLSCLQVAVDAGAL